MKDNNVRLQGHESEMCNFNFHVLSICQPRCVVMFEDSGLYIGFVMKVTISGSVHGL